MIHHSEFHSILWGQRWRSNGQNKARFSMLPVVAGAIRGYPRTDLGVFLTLFLLCCFLMAVPTGQAFDGHSDLIRQLTNQPSKAANGTDDEKDIRTLEPGKPIKREMAGGQQHSYLVRLKDNQFLKTIVEQDGIDVVVQVSGPNGKFLIEVDSERRLQGQEEAPLVAEVAGDYQLMVRPQLKSASGGSYQIRIEELRAATDTDRALQEGRKQYEESLKLERAGKYDEALLLAQRVLEIRERYLTVENHDVAEAIIRLADIYTDRGEYVKAEPFYRRALDICENMLGKDHPSTARSLNNLAGLYYLQGRQLEAEPLYRRALDIKEKALGKDHLSIAKSLNNLAMLYGSQGKYAEAEPLYQRALDIFEKALGKDHPDTAECLSNLAGPYFLQGKYADAEPLFKRALDIKEKALGKDHLDTARSLNNLAVLYREQGRYAEAEPLFRRALATQEKTLGKDHPSIARSLNNLASLYSLQGKYVEAEPLYRRALVIRETALGKDHPETAQSINNLAELYHLQGKRAEAEPLCKRALDIFEKALGKDHPDTADSLDNLGLLYQEQGKYAEAESLHQRALDIFEKALGKDHPSTTDSLNNLARLYTSKGDFAQAVKFQSRANAAGERNIALNLAIGSEREKLDYLALFSRQTDFTLSLHSQAASNDSQALNLAFTTLLRRKGRGLDAMTNTIAALRRHATPENQILFDQLAQARSQLAAFTLRKVDSAKPDEYHAQLKPLEERVEELEAALSERSAEFCSQSQPVTIAAVQAALPAGSALIEFAVYTPQDLRTRNNKPPRYLAYLLASEGQPRWIGLGEAAPIDKAVMAWRKALRDPQRADVKRLACAVYEKILRPVRALLSGMPGQTRQLLVAPDGSLNLIPLAALVDEENRYLIERYTISYLTSGRDLLRLHTSPPSKSAPLVIANPSFGRIETIAAQGDQDSGKSQMDSQAWGQIDPTVIFFQSLPGTEREALAIKSVLPGASVLLRKQATETALKQAKAPSVLHIATHGFFLSDEAAPAAETHGISDDNPLRLPIQLSKWTAKIDNPLLRSGLALAGANEHRSGDDDGVLTSMEAASLDLWGTRLVVLSGCDTGVGEIKNGEGVYGLRRALVLAGSETQVISLWPVSDNEAHSLMAGYYRRLLNGEGRGESLRQIQLEMLKDAKLRHPHYWGSFIQSGEWANLDGQR